MEEQLMHNIYIEAPTRVGFIGLGMMGLPMLENLAGHTCYEILAHDLDDAPFETLSAHPAWGHTLRRATTLADAARNDIVITMLPNSAITNAVIAGEEGGPGIADELAAGALVIDMGSSNPVDTMALASRLVARGAALIDAPVSGAVAKARAGTLTIMAGGPTEALERARPLFEKMGSTIIPTGAVGSAHAMKALNNYVYAAGLLAASEVLLIAERMNLDLARFEQVLNASSGRNVATETKLKQFVIPRTFAGGFALRLQSKDLATAAALRALTCVEAPQLSLCQQLWSEAVEMLEPGADNTEIFRFIEKRSGRAAGSLVAVR
jgi:3-hydroxyisobutyrate dehydrogenase